MAGTCHSVVNGFYCSRRKFILLFIIISYYRVIIWTVARVYTSMLPRNVCFILVFRHYFQLPITLLLIIYNVKVLKIKKKTGYCRYKRRVQSQ